jgi:hypothetical protein
MQRECCVFDERRASCPPDFKSTRTRAECRIPFGPDGGHEARPLVKAGFKLGFEKCATSKRASELGILPTPMPGLIGIGEVFDLACRSASIAAED